MATEQDYQNWADWEEYQNSLRPSGPVALEETISPIQQPVNMNVNLGERADLPGNPYQSVIDFNEGKNLGEASIETNNLMAEGYNKGAGIANKLILEGLGAAALPIAEVPEMVNLATRAAIYGGNALKGSIGLEVGTAGANFLQGQEQKSLGDTATSVAKNTMIGMGAPLALEGIGNAFQWVKNLFNKAPITSSRLGATSVDLNPNAEKYIVPKVQELMDNSDFFNKNILTSANPSKQYELAKGYKDLIGGQIGDFYASNQAIPVLRDEIIGSQSVQKLIALSQNPNITEGTRAEAMQALTMLNSGLPNKQVLNLADVWQLRKDLDSQIVSSLFRKGTGEVTNFSEYVLDAANGVRSSMENAITRATALPGEMVNGIPPVGKISPSMAERLIRNKQEFSNINAVTEVLGRKVGQTSGTDLLDKVRNYPLLTKPFSFLSPGVDLLRTGATRLGNLGAGMMAAAPMLNPYANMGSSLFPRSTDLKELNTKDLSESVYDKLVNFIGPEAAQAEALNLEKTLINGNPDVKKQALAQISMMFPDLFEPMSEGVMTIDGEYISPLDKDSIVRNSLNLPPSERAQRIGKAFENKYVPSGSSLPMEVQNKSIDIDMVMNSLNGAFEATNSYSDTSSMTNEMKLNQIIHAQDF